MIKVIELIDEFSALLAGDVSTELSIASIAAIDNYTETDLVVCTNKEHLSILNKQAKLPAVLVTSAALLKNAPSDLPVLSSPNPRLVQALLKQKLDDYDPTDSEWDNPHSSATIHSSAKLGKNCRIGPKVVIGKNVVIGENSIIRSGTVIEHDTVIGDHCIIHNLVNIGYGSKLGNNVIIRPGAIIGNEGFGFAEDDKKQYQRIPHTGYVLIEDNVVIGSNTNIDRGTYGVTLIGSGTKIDSLCHIAHNVTIGENCIIVSQCGIAGSTKVGDRVIMSGQTGVLDHINITNDVTLIHRAGVVQDITEKGVWGGLPPKPFRDHMRRNSIEKTLMKKISALEKRLQELEQDD